MDFVVGRTQRVSPSTEKTDSAGTHIEAKILHVREPRRRRDPRKGDDSRKSGSPAADPPGARVLVMLVPDAFRLPEDLESGEYRVFLRIARR